MALHGMASCSVCFACPCIFGRLAGQARAQGRARQGRAGQGREGGKRDQTQLRNSCEATGVTVILTERRGDTPNLELQGACSLSVGLVGSAASAASASSFCSWWWWWWWWHPSAVPATYCAVHPPFLPPPLGPPLGQGPQQKHAANSNERQQPPQTGPAHSLSRLLSPQGQGTQHNSNKHQHPFSAHTFLFSQCDRKRPCSTCVRRGTEHLCKTFSTSELDPEG